MAVEVDEEEKEILLEKIVELIRGFSYARS